MGKLLNDEGFRHISYHATDVKKTWARERARLKELKAKQDAESEAVKAEQAVKVRVIKWGAAS